jgi:predicted ArsR family transcriptional regulator
MAEFAERLIQEEAKLKLAIYFARELLEEVGKEKALEIIEKAWAKYGADNMSGRLEGVPQEDRLKALGEWFKKQVKTRPELKVVEATPKKLCIELSWCPTYEICKKLGVLEICQKYCDSDYISAEAIHPKVKMVRDKALAYGADRCNHCWVMEE